MKERMTGGREEGKEERSIHSQLILNPLSAWMLSSLVKGMSIQRLAPDDRLTLCVLPNASIEEGVFSIEWLLSSTLIPTTAVVEAWRLDTSTVKPAGLVLTM